MNINILKQNLKLSWKRLFIIIVFLYVHNFVEKMFLNLVLFDPFVKS
jgi:hypothetical protein